MAVFSDDYHQSKVYEGQYEKEQACSIHECSIDKWENRRAVSKFHKTYGQYMSTFDCWYDPMSYEWGVVIEIKLPTLSVLHAMFWPTLAFITATASCCEFCRRCRTREECKEDKVGIIEVTSENGKKHKRGLFENKPKIEAVPMEELTKPITDNNVHTVTVDIENDIKENISPAGKKCTKAKNKSSKRTTKNLKDVDAEKATEAEKKPWL